MTGKMERVAPSSSRPGGGSLSGTGGGLLYGEPSLSLGIPDEYNPLCPNDYEELARKKRDKRKADVSFFLPVFFSLTGPINLKGFLPGSVV